MITFKIISTGKAPSDWRSEAFDHYVKMLKPYAKVEDIHVREQKIRSEADVESALKTEADGLMKGAGNGRIIALHDRGKRYNTEKFAEHIADLAMTGSVFSFLIGSAHGLDSKVLEKSDEVLSLSDFTLPHDLARIVLVEQLYRAMSIICNLPYHK